MTSRKTSELGYYQRGAAARLQGNWPLDTAGARFGVANNLNHLQDQSTQISTTMCQTDPAFAGVGYWTQASTTANTFARLDGMPPSFTFLRWQSDGSSSRVVVTLKGYTSTAGKVATFRAFLQPLAIGRLPTISPPAPSTTTVTADMTEATGTSTVMRCTLYVPRLSDAWLYGARSTDGTGAASAVSFYCGRVEVWATTDDGTAHPRLEAISVREYVG